jgi:hypothetical protein
MYPPNQGNAGGADEQKLIAAFSALVVTLHSVRVAALAEGDGDFSSASAFLQLLLGQEAMGFLRLFAGPSGNRHVDASHRCSKQAGWH